MNSIIINIIISIDYEEILVGKYLEFKVWYWGNVNSQGSKLSQLNIMGTAREALAFRKDFLGNPVKGFLKE